VLIGDGAMMRITSLVLVPPLECDPAALRLRILEFAPVTSSIPIPTMLLPCDKPEPKLSAFIDTLEDGHERCMLVDTPEFRNQTAVSEGFMR
jgi:hypothetical protein